MELILPKTYVLVFLDDQHLPPYVKLKSFQVKISCPQFSVLLQLLALKRRNTAEAPNSKGEIDHQGFWSSNRSRDNSPEINLDLSGTSVMSSPVSSSHLGNSKHAQVAPARPPSLPRPDLHHCLRMDQPIAQEESQLICNMFNGIDDHQNFWTWGTATEQQQQFNWSIDQPIVEAQHNNVSIFFRL